MSNRSFADMFNELPVGELIAGVAGEMLMPKDPVRLDERGLFIPTTEAKAQAIVKTDAGFMMAVTVQKVK